MLSFIIVGSNGRKVARLILLDLQNNHFKENGLNYLFKNKTKQRELWLQNSNLIYSKAFFPQNYVAARPSKFTFARQIEKFSLLHKGNIIIQLH